MANVIDMQMMRHLNLFSKITKVYTTKVFSYNNKIIFAVPKSKLSTAIGKQACNVKKMSETIRKQIRIVAMPRGDDTQGIKNFIEAVVSPVEFNGLEMKSGGMIINAGRESKAALIGRNRQREKELSSVVKDFFGIKNLKIL